VVGIGNQAQTINKDGSRSKKKWKKREKKRTRTKNRSSPTTPNSIAVGRGGHRVGTVSSQAWKKEKPTRGPKSKRDDMDKSQEKLVVDA